VEILLPFVFNIAENVPAYLIIFAIRKIMHHLFFYPAEMYRNSSVAIQYRQRYHLRSR